MIDLYNLIYMLRHDSNPTRDIIEAIFYMTYIFDIMNRTQFIINKIDVEGLNGLNYC
jgi:hypothetical protein